MKIVAITACPAGIAHTYMAAKKLETTAQSLGHEIHVEKQGVKGIEDRLSSDDIKQADVVILAVDAKVKEEERFEGKHVYRCPVSDPIKDAKAVIEAALSREEKKTSFLGELKNHVLTGVSYMIPLVIGSSLMMGIARVAAMAFGIGDIWDASYDVGGVIGFLYTLNNLGSIALGLMLTVFGGYVSYSIADKQGLAAGFAGGALANSIGAGFFGALAAGLFAGYFTKWFTKTVQFKGALSGLNLIVTALVSLAVTMLAINYVIGVPFIWLNTALTDFLTSMSGANSMIVAFIVGAMMCADLGGPINKAAMVTSMGLISSGVYAPNTAAMIGIVIPVLGYGIYSIAFGKQMSDEFRDAGSASLVMGLVGVSEGAIPFTLANPKILVPANIIGGGVGAAVAVGMGAVNTTTLSGCYGWLLVENPLAYVLGILVGALIVCGGAILAKKSFQETL